MRTCRPLLTPLLLVSLAACNSGGAPPSEAEIEATCSDVCDAAAECFPDQDDEVCREGCAFGGGLSRADGFREYTSCLLDAGCEPAQTRCLAELSESPGFVAYADSCEARLTDCGLGGETSEQICNQDLIKLLSDEILDMLISCFEEPCTEIRDCTMGALEIYVRSSSS